MKKIILIITLFSVLSGVNAQENDTIELVSSTEFKEVINSQKVQLVDVRTPGEYKQGAIKNSINLDFFNQKQFMQGIEKLDKCEPVYVYCHSGGRSHKAAVIMKNMGFEKIYDLKGGFSNY